ncbi:hypothetical protein PF003_g38562 [Phytophthora fragariae]|nr:hypothetical protein PF003_g38562 [Phytophthora fragariae]
MNFVPEGYYHAAQEKLEDPAMTEVPELWEPLPTKPAPGSPDSSLSWLHSSDDDDDEDDDKFDKTYHGKTTASSGSASARSQSDASGKRPRGSGSGGKGSATKVAKTSTQSSAGYTSRPKAKLPAPLPDDGLIEPPKKGSWCHYGIKVQALNHQTMGFPSYMPVQPLLQHPHVRWVPIEYWELIQTCPWDDMWQRRISTLVFFKFSEVSSEMAEAIELVLNFMSRWRREYWERYHWVTMDPDFDYYATPKLRAIPELSDMYRDRKDRHSDFDTHRKKMMAEVQKTPGYSDRIWFEPGLWVVPQNKAKRSEAQTKIWQELSERLKKGFAVGDAVWLYLARVQPGLTKKFAHRWHGPFRILETSDDFRCKLKIEGSGYKLYPWVHVSRLKPRALFPDRPTEEIEVAEEDDFDAALLAEDVDSPDEAQDEYEVESIQDVRWVKRTRTSKRVREYLVKWKGYTETDWLPMSQLNCGALLYDFNQSAKAQARFRAMQAGDELPEPETQ